MSTLYQKYRPKTFSELVNQNHIKITLQNEIAQNKVGHSYLLYGPRAVGKTTTARLLAKAVNCEKRKDGESEPCNDCDSCNDINNDRSLDIIEIDAASHTGVDNVRENIIAGARVSTSKRKFKVFIIDEVHMLSISAFNALLKTLEEPPKNVIFILATTEIHKVPATIISRCQKFHFKKISDSEMFERLKFLSTSENKIVDDEVLQSIARNVGGYVRDAESLLGQILSLDEKHITKDQAEIIIPASNFNLIAEFVEHIINKDKIKAIEHINNLVEEGVDLEVFGKDLIEFLRKLMFSKISNTLDNFSISLNKETEDKVSKMKEKVEINYILKALHIFMARTKELKNADIAQLPLEIAIIELTEGPKANFFSNSRPNEGEKIATVKNMAQTGEPEGSLKKIFNFTSNAINKITAKENEKEKTSKSEKVNFTFDDVQKKWPDVINHIRENEPALSFMLSSAMPQNLKGNALELGFKYKFHCESMKVNGKIEKLENILQNILGERLRIICFSDLTIDINFAKVSQETEMSQISQNEEEITSDQTENENDLAGILDMFGGKVIE
ncbi:MAG: DNA polymerase III subunit gamma/tau [bacterium]